MAEAHILVVVYQLLVCSATLPSQCNEEERRLIGILKVAHGISISSEQCACGSIGSRMRLICMVWLLRYVLSTLNIEHCFIYFKYVLSMCCHTECHLPDNVVSQLYRCGNVIPKSVVMLSMSVVSCY